jgi:hypothetical protein
MSFELAPTPKIALSEIIAQQNQERGLQPLALEPDLLLSRITQGGHSGQFLADAYLSAYRGNPFPHSLKEITKLDYEGFRLFHGILHMRHITGWDDNALYETEQKILTILRG